MPENGYEITQPNELFNLVQTQSNTDENKSTKSDGSAVYEELFRYHTSVNKTKSTIEDFLQQHNWSSQKDYQMTGEGLCLELSSKTKEVIDMIASLNALAGSTKRDLQSLRGSLVDLREKVANFIETVTTKLPEGGDINLLIIGKTGHGKSSTANSILGSKMFKTSSNGMFETAQCQVGEITIDRRHFKVVDIPGVCDTSSNSLQSVELAMSCASDAIATCSEGFHALLLVIRYGTRMTDEEQRAIELLKCILGPTIVHSHCICVVTHGDNYDETIEGSFTDWCLKQEGFMKDFFKECNYRCVLFNNNTSKNDILIPQRIELVSQIDGLEHRSSSYTNYIFELAKRDRERLMDEIKLPKLRNDILEDLEMLQNEFDKIKRANRNEREDMLHQLKENTETLRSKLKDINCGGVADLHPLIYNFSERLSRMEEKENIEALLEEERKLIAEQKESFEVKLQSVEREIAENTEKRVRETLREANLKDTQLIEMQSKLNELEDQNCTLEEEITRLSLKLDNYKQQEVTMKYTLNQMCSELEQKKSENTLLNTDRATLEADIEVFQYKIATNTQERRTMEQSLNEFKDKVKNRTLGKRIRDVFRGTYSGIMQYGALKESLFGKRDNSMALAVVGQHRLVGDGKTNSQNNL